MTDSETIRLEVADGLARLTLDRPDRLNGMTNQMVRETHDASRRWLRTRRCGCWC